MERSMSTLLVRGLESAHGGRAIVRGVDITLEKGEVRVLMGVSGSGKSTILRAIAALHPFTAGSISVEGTELRPGALPSQRSLGELRRKVGMVFQSHALFEHLTALENVTLAPIHALGWTVAEARRVALELLGSLGVEGRGGAYPRQLSGGEAQRVAIARALAPGPRLLLLDEPTSALDPARRGSLGAVLRRLAAEGQSLLIATHDVDFARDHSDTVSVMAEGRIMEDGRAVEVLGNPAHRATRELLAEPMV
jgi:ABC-type polar amino acid transport system ATPase subunit